MAANKSVLFLPGDGIGAEVAAEVKKVIDWMGDNRALTFDVTDGLIGGTAYDQTGSPLPRETIEAAHAADAVLLGAVGGPKWETLPFEDQPERGLLGIRKEMGLFANLRPALVFDALADASTLKYDVVAGLDIMILRELSSGIYFGEPRGIEDLGGGKRRGYNTLTYTSDEVRRIGEVAFDLAAKRDKRVCSIDNANVLQATVMWREEMIKVGERHPDIELSHMYVDNAAMQLVRNPKQFDVVVTTNMFGDILSDCAAMLTGSLGMLPSASLGEPDESGNRPALYEPVHGSAPDITGQGIANPLATILSGAMMLRHLGEEAAAESVEKASLRVVALGETLTPDLGGTSRTEDVGDAVVAALT